MSSKQCCTSPDIVNRFHRLRANSVYANSNAFKDYLIRSFFYDCDEIVVCIAVIMPMQQFYTTIPKMLIFEGFT